MPVLRILALAALLALAVPTVAQADNIDLRRKISVSGESTTIVANDAARLRLGVQATRASARLALRAASRQMQRVIGAVRAAGVAPADIRTNNIGVTKLRRHAPKHGRAEPSGYRATQGITVVVHEVRTTGTVIDRAVGAGATRVAGPEFFVSDAARSYRDALGLAFDEARAKAQLLAERSGAKLGVALSIDENQTAEPYQQAADMSSSGAAVKAAPTPARPGQSRVEATVVVVFELIE